MNALQESTQAFQQSMRDAQDPVQPEWTTLFSEYATPTEIEVVRELYAQIDLAHSDVIHIQTALTGTNRQLSQTQSRSREDKRSRAAAIALGEVIKAEPAATGPSVADLEDQQKGLEHRLKQATEDVERRKGKFRAAVFDLVRTCANRCAEDYAELTRRQGWCHQQISLAQELTGQDLRMTLVGPEWGRYFVPGSAILPALKGKTQEEHFIPTLMSGQRLTATIPKARAGLQAHGLELFGAFPL